jgi:hypothetical protein
VAKRAWQASIPEEGLPELATMLPLDLTNLQPMTIAAPITRDVHSCDFVTEMMARALAP